MVHDASVVVFSVLAILYILVMLWSPEGEGEDEYISRRRWIDEDHDGKNEGER